MKPDNKNMVETKGGFCKGLDAITSKNYSCHLQATLSSVGKRFGLSLLISTLFDFKLLQDH